VRRLTVWRMLIQADLSAVDVQIRECISAGEPLNPEVIEQVRSAWDVTIRDGYGQTETTAPDRQPARPAGEARLDGPPLPGYSIALVDPVTDEVGDDGEICIELAPPAGAVDAGLPRRRRPQCRGDARRFLPHRRRREPG